MLYIYMVTFTINIPQMLVYMPYMDPMGRDNMSHRGVQLNLTRHRKIQDATLHRRNQRRKKMANGTSLGSTDPASRKSLTTGEHGLQPWLPANWLRSDPSRSRLKLTR